MVAANLKCEDPTVLDLWHPLGALAEMEPGRVIPSMLLGYEIEFGADSADSGWARRVEGGPLPVTVRYGYLWTSVGKPTGDVFDIPEAEEDDRRVMNGGSIKVAVSAPRAVENFLDMGHFPYVHNHLLGEEPHSEVYDYSASIETGEVGHAGMVHSVGPKGEVWARDCRFYQPMAAASAKGGQISQYTYRVPHPYCTMLYKSVPTDPSRRDVIAIFLQAMTEETIVAHNFLAIVDDESSDNVLRQFQQVIFSQDKPILENQYPKRLPLDPRAETPIKADRTSIVYRRWLGELGLTYGVIPA